MRALHDDLDVLVIGSGIAGLSAAIALAGKCNVAVISKEDGGGGSTELAQGGVAAALSAPDSPSAHAADTLAAAAGLGDPDVVAAITGGAPEAVQLLASLGVVFDEGAPAREGGHGAARVVHARGDATGAEISRALMEAASRSGVAVVPGVSLLDLSTRGGRVTGAVVREEAALEETLRDEVVGTVRHVRAGTVILATGGYGHLWAGTTSPPACSGAGLAAALRAGAQAADLEFVQFHPTGMVLGRDPRPLATEALRGAGARLRDARGRLLHERSGPGVGDLAPRDVVSASMAQRMARLGADFCYLDATVLEAGLLLSHFPTFVAACRDAGLDPRRDWVPVSPTAHYTMGGVLAGADGRTTLHGLLAVGEVACTGLHGANRLASNSLLEGAVAGRRAAQAVLLAEGPPPAREAVEPSGALPERGAPSVTRHVPFGQAELRTAMQTSAGVSRDAEGLGRLAGLLAGPPPQHELAGMSLVARAVTALALRREESRGAHRRSDFPASDPRWRARQVVELQPGGELDVGELGVAGRGDGEGELEGPAAVGLGGARVKAAAAAR